jgi:hypothetical protein
MNNTDEKAIKISKLIREIKNKKKDITTKLIMSYVDVKYNPDGLLKTGEMIEKVENQINQEFNAIEMFKKEDGEKILQKHIWFLDEILSRKEAANKKSTQNLIIGGVILLLVAWLSFDNIDKKYEEERTPSVSTISDYSSKAKLKDDCKWCNILRYAILKNDNNKAVQCRQNYINNGYYILCTYEAGGYNKRALFYEGLDEVYAVNGTARTENFTKHSDIKLYDPTTQGSVDIREILSRF